MYLKIYHETLKLKTTTMCGCVITKIKCCNVRQLNLFRSHSDICAKVNIFLNKRKSLNCLKKLLQHDPYYVLKSC